MDSVRGLLPADLSFDQFEVFIFVGFAGVLERSVAWPSPGTDYPGILFEFLMIAGLQCTESIGEVDHRFPI